jgi:hypothetical protein
MGGSPEGVGLPVHLEESLSVAGVCRVSRRTRKHRDKEKEAERMKKVAAFLALLLVFAAGAQWASAGVTVFVIGTVTGYEVGKNITVLDDNGAHAFLLTEDVEQDGAIDAGMTVAVEAMDGTARSIGILDSYPQERPESNRRHFSFFKILFPE